MSSYLAQLQAFKEDPKAVSEGQYFGASLMPGTGEAIAAYELPGILSQAKEMIQGDDTLRAFGGLGLATLGTAAVLPFVGPGARFLKKTLQGIEEFAPYMGPKLAAEGVDTSRLAMSDQGDLFTGSSPSAKTTDKNFAKNYVAENFPKFLYHSPRGRDITDGIKKYDHADFSPDRLNMPDGKGIYLSPTPLDNQAVKIDVSKLPVEKLRDLQQTGQAEGYFTFNKDIPANAIVKDNLNLGSGSLFSAESKKGRKLLIVSCSDTKCPDDGDMKAMDRYLGPIFQTLKAQGVPPNVDVAIMSAKHGLIKADTPLKDYDLKMTKDLASKFKGDLDQMNRIKNTMSGYDDVIVQGGKDYKDVLRTAAGDMNIKEIPGGRGIGDQRELMMNAIAPFRKINTPVYHFTKNTDPGFTKFDIDRVPFFEMGPHVASTPKGAKDRFMDLTYGFGGRQIAKEKAKELNISYDEAITKMDLPEVTGNVGYRKVGKGKFSLPIPRKTLGGSIPLKANLTKPFLNPKTNKPFTESSLNDYQAEQYSKFKGENFTTDDILGENPKVDRQDVKKFIRSLSRDLAEKGYTHVPYENVVEGVGDLSYVMLIDRPKGKPKVLQGTFAKKDPAAADDPDFMKAEGGVVEMKERAINMNRRPQGIEPFIKYMQNGGNPELERMNQELRQIEGNPELEGEIQRLREEPIMDGNTIRYRTEEEIQRIIQQMLRQPNIDITPEGGIKIRPSVEITGDTPSRKTFMGTLGGEELFFEDQDLRTRARLGVDVELPKGDRAGMGARASYFKGTRDFPEQVAQFGFPDKVRRGSGKINYGDIDAYYSMQGGPTISGRYNPVTEQYGGQINYGMPLRDMGIPQLSEKAVNMFRRLVR